MNRCGRVKRAIRAGIAIASFFGAAVGAADRDAWGPLESASCAVHGKRTVSAQFWAKSGTADLRLACSMAARNVMGNQVKPIDCSLKRYGLNGELAAFGKWEVADSTCETQLLKVPPPGGHGDPKSQMPLEGYADIHVHQMAHLAFGGSIIWGGAYGDPKVVLGPIPNEFRRGHDITDDATNGKLVRTFVNTLIGHVFRHGEKGFPTFSDWPAHAQMTHQQVYEDWLHRAYVGGLRLMVMLAENSEDMFGRGENNIPVIGGMKIQSKMMPGRTGNDMEALEWQIREAYRMQAHIDTKHGGNGWYRIVRDPDEASDVIKGGRLAVVLGAEIQHLFNCDTDRPACTKDVIVEGLNRLEGMGVRYVFPVHHKLNQFGGPAQFQPVNNGPTWPCKEYVQPCSSIGLTDLGKFLVRELMARGMMIDTEHLSRKAFDDIMEIAGQNKYPLMASHVVLYSLLTSEEQTERSRTADQLKRLFMLGGMVAPLMGASANEYARFGEAPRVRISCNRKDGGSVDQWANAYLFLRDLAKGSPFENVGLIAMGSDWNGVAGWPGPRHAKNDPCPLTITANGEPVPVERPVEYPIRLPENLVPAASGGTTQLDLYKWPDTSVTWDYNERGMAHVGLMPEFLENLRLLGLSMEDMEPLYRSARGVVELWRRAEATKPAAGRGSLRWVPFHIFDVLEAESAVEANRRALLTPDGERICRLRGTRVPGREKGGRCLPTGGHVDRLHRELERSQISTYHAGRCMAVEGASLDPGQKLTQRPCDTSAAQLWRLGVREAKWTESGEHEYQIVNAHSSLCLTAGQLTDSAGFGARLEICEEAKAQNWQAKRVGNTFELHSVIGVGCLEVPDQSRGDGIALQFADCSKASNQLWSIEGLRFADYEILQRVGAKGGEWLARSALVGAEQLPGISTVCVSEDSDSLIGLVVGDICVGTGGSGASRYSRSFKFVYVDDGSTVDRTDRSSVR